MSRFRTLLRLRGRALTGRLVATAVALVALVSLLVVSLSALAMHDYLTGRLDTDLRGSGARGGGPGPGAEPSGTDRDGRGGAWRFGDGPGTLRASFGDTMPGGAVIRDDAGAVPLSERDLAVLSAVSPDEGSRVVELPDAGEYRVVAEEYDGVIRVTALPTDRVDGPVGNLLVWGLALVGLGVIVAGLAGTALVKRQLAPPREVAATAHEVSELPLATGEIDLSARVPDRLTDVRTEVGQVGAAFNRMLTHVEASLEARHRSEQQVRQFVADASHELRTPLATIAGYAELAKRRPDDVAGIRTALDKVESESDRMTALVEDLLLLARLDAGRPLERRTVDLTRLLVEAVSDARVLAPAHRWRLELPDEPVEVMGDEHRLHQVVTNLLTNARRHTPDGTTVTVSARPGELRVHDDGPGFPEELRETAFERFVRGDTARTRDGGAGAGLGLSLVEAIVTAHGGRVRLDSVPGDTVVTVSLRAPATS